MEKDNTISQEQLPYSSLAKIGISREMADRLPQEFRQKLADGEVTPLIEVSIRTRNGQTLTLPLKLQISEDKAGNPLLLAYPVKNEMDVRKSNELRLTPFEAERLAKGEVIMKAVDVKGTKTQQYLQLDNETKSIIHKRVTDLEIEKRLRDMEKVNDIELGTQQKQQVREGKPMELNVGGEKVTVGIDLREPQGFRVMQGDMKEWERQQKLHYDDLHPEFLGLRQTDENRWEYQQIVDKQSRERAIKFGNREEKKAAGLKL